MSNCEKNAKCQKVKHTDYGGSSQKKKKKNSHTVMRFTHIDVNFGVKYEGHQNCSETLSMHILRVFMSSYVMSKLTSICVNLIRSMSIYFVCEPPP